MERLKFVKHIMHSTVGEVVAVTASGVNDDQVLTSADVGLTMVTFSTSSLNVKIIATDVIINLFASEVGTVSPCQPQNEE